MTQESPIVLCNYCQRVIATDPVSYRGEKYHRECFTDAKP